MQSFIGAKKRRNESAGRNSKRDCGTCGGEPKKESGKSGRMNSTSMSSVLLRRGPRRAKHGGHEKQARVMKKVWGSKDVENADLRSRSRYSSGYCNFPKFPMFT